MVRSDGLETLTPPTEHGISKGQSKKALRQCRSSTIPARAQIEIGQRGGFGVAVFLGPHQPFVEFLQLFQISRSQQRDSLFRRETFQEQANLTKLSLLARDKRVLFCS